MGYWSCHGWEYVIQTAPYGIHSTVHWPDLTDMIQRTDCCPLWTLLSEFSTTFYTIQRLLDSRSNEQCRTGDASALVQAENEGPDLHVQSKHASHHVSEAKVLCAKAPMRVCAQLPCI